MRAKKRCSFCFFVESYRRHCERSEAISCAEIPSVAQPVLSECEGLPRNDVGDPSLSAQDDDSQVPLNSGKNQKRCFMPGWRNR